MTQSKGTEPLIGLAEQVDAFLSHLKNERRLSRHTLAAYQHDLTALLKYACEADIDQAQDLKAADIRGLISQGHRKGLSGRSQQRKLSEPNQSTSATSPPLSSEMNSIKPQHSTGTHVKN